MRGIWGLIIARLALSWSFDVDYFQKIEQKPTPDLTWNIPETKKGSICVVGGNAQSFRAEVKVSEFLTGKYPVETVTTVLPDALRGQLPDLPNLVFVGSTESGSLADGGAVGGALSGAEFSIVLGDLSKNSITGKMCVEVVGGATRPVLVTRDTVDALAEHQPERTLMNEQVVLFASMPQLIKIFRAVYYPKMLLLSQSLVQVVDALHKFTLSYPVKIVTLHSGQILMAENGVVRAVPLDKSGYTPINFWQGELAAKIAVLNLYNPGNFLDATICGIFA